MCLKKNRDVGERAQGKRTGKLNAENSKLKANGKKAKGDGGMLLKGQRGKVRG
jgi:hypothetical protein